MYGSVVKGLALLVSTAVAVPYTVALLCNILYGWPQNRSKYRRALSPRKVYALNYTVIRKLMLIKYAALFWKWKMHYRNAHRYEILKDVCFGRNDRTLDIYHAQIEVTSDLKPVVIFIYGGAWGSGDKNVYSLACTQIAQRLGALVCCPNYSIYPQGYVDDMIQDVVDCISWTYENIESYGGDKDKIILIGHSAGAHLSAMAILELLHDERVNDKSVRRGTRLTFDDGHYKRSDKGDAFQESSGSSDSFAVLGGNSEPMSLEASTTTSMFEVISGQSLSDIGDTSIVEVTKEDVAMSDESETPVELTSDDVAMSDETETSVELSKDDVMGDDIDKLVSEAIEVLQRSSSHEEELEEDSGDNDSVITVRPKDIERHPTLVDLCKSIKAFIGLAGVYQIDDHYLHEMGRGVEDISSMGRAMYGEDHFDRFSPTVIVKHLERSISLPKVVLVHGTEDCVVPLSSTTKFAEALSDVFADIVVRILPDCNHFDVCLDLMEPGRKYHDSVMGIIMETANRVV